MNKKEEFELRGMSFCKKFSGDCDVYLRCDAAEKGKGGWR